MIYLAPLHPLLFHKYKHPLGGQMQYIYFFCLGNMSQEWEVESTLPSAADHFDWQEDLADKTIAQQIFLSLLPSTSRDINMASNQDNKQ